MQTIATDLLRRCDLEGPISSSSCVDCDEFETPFLSAAKQAEEDGNSDQASVYRLLAALCSFHFKPEDKIEPFSNKIGFADGSRTLVGSDFNPSQINDLHSLVGSLKNTVLRTRIADLVWSRDKSKADCGRSAIDGYVELVTKLISGTTTKRFSEPDPTGISAEDFLRRAAHIARSTGWRRPENDALKSCMADVLTIASRQEDMSVARIGRLATDVGLEAAESILSGLSDLVDTVLKKPDHFVAEAIQRLIIRRAHLSGNKEIARSAILKLSSIFESKAELVSSATLKTHALQEAIDSLHGVKGVREERQRLHEKLKDAQIHMFEEFGTFEYKVDLTDEIQRILSGYDGLDLLDALRLLARTELPPSPEQLATEAQEQARQFPLSSLFASSLIDQKGRTVARTSGGLEDDDDALRYKIIQSESTRINVAVAGAINPARERITGRYMVDYDILYEICLISPFVPSGSEHAFARGIEAFLFADEFMATACLVPLLEAGLRALVETAGRSDTKISAGGIEATIGLGPLLSYHRDILETVFSKSLIFAIESLFAHDMGPKVRHSYCHGLARDTEFFSHNYVYANKLIFSLVVLAICGEGWSESRSHILRKLGRPADYYGERIVSY